MATSERATVVDQTVERIKASVMRGHYAPGQRLVEADLTTELGVSRGPLREALSRLTADGLIVIEPYRGATVRKLSRADVVELFEVRTALEVEAAALAAERIDAGSNPERIQGLRSGIARLRKIDDPQAHLDDNTEFHNTIVEIAANSLLASLIDHLHIQAYRMQFRQLLTPEARHVSLKDHEAILDAILDGDPARARRAMRRHVDRSRKATLALPDEGFA